MAQLKTPKALSTALRVLSKSPLFGMSLSSKELFHSNVLAWLIEHDQDLLNYLVAIAFGDQSPGRWRLLLREEWADLVRNQKWPSCTESQLQSSDPSSPHDVASDVNVREESSIGRYELYREHGRKIDLMFRVIEIASNCDTIRTVYIENKFKSLPDLLQLQRYQQFGRQSLDSLPASLRGRKSKKSPGAKIDRNRLTIDLRKMSGCKKIDIAGIIVAPAKPGWVGMGAEIDVEMWRFLDWDSLLKNLPKSLGKPFNTKFANHCIKDYKAFTGALLDVLNEEIRRVSVNGHALCYADWIKFESNPTQQMYTDLRIHDFVNKYVMSYILDVAIYGGSTPLMSFDHKSRRLIGILSEESWNWEAGYSVGQGRLTIERTVCDDLREKAELYPKREQKRMAVGLQLQGSQWRHYVGSRDGESWLVDMARDVATKQQDLFFSDFYDGNSSSQLTIMEPVSLSVTPKAKKHRQEGFGKFDDERFLYRYFPIKCMAGNELQHFSFSTVIDRIRGFVNELSKSSRVVPLESVICPYLGKSPGQSMAGSTLGPML